jgi:hypothetical protein
MQVNTIFPMTEVEFKVREAGNRPNLQGCTLCIDNKLNEPLAGNAGIEMECLLAIIKLLLLEYTTLQEKYREDARCSVQKLFLANDIILRMRHVLADACNGDASSSSCCHSTDYMDDS